VTGEPRGSESWLWSTDHSLAQLFNSLIFGSHSEGRSDWNSKKKKGEKGN